MVPLAIYRSFFLIHLRVGESPGSEYKASASIILSPGSLKKKNHIVPPKGKSRQKIRFNRPPLTLNFELADNTS